MLKEIHVPPLGESVTEATVAKWLKQQGDVVKMDEPLVELETDKVTLEVNAAQSGILQQIIQAPGSVVKINEVLGVINTESTNSVSIPSEPQPIAPAAPLLPNINSSSDNADNRLKLSPAVRKMVSEAAIDPTTIAASGKDGRLIKADVQTHLNHQAAVPGQPTTLVAAPISQLPQPIVQQSHPHYEDREQRVPMSRLRHRIAERLKNAQNTAALLTTFNEVDMTNVMALRAQYRDSFEKKHGVKLGFMSFFVKACVAALQEIPAVNAEIDGDDIVYKKYYDISVAVSTLQGLVVPVVRDADMLSFAGIEKKINELSIKARDNKLTITDLTGGTFTITNGGTFGSMMSTPIVNPPQSAILGMHKIQQRPMAIDGKVEIRAMMYLALTYDHRIIDGREAVTFLVRVKECIENPERILLEI